MSGKNNNKNNKKLSEEETDFIVVTVKANDFINELYIAKQSSSHYHMVIERVARKTRPMRREDRPLPSRSSPHENTYCYINKSPWSKARLVLQL